MSQRSRKAKPAKNQLASQATPRKSGLTWLISGPGLIVTFAFVVLIFYFTPLFDRNASIQWDAVDVHYTAQKYFSDAIRGGHLPFWTGDLFSGFPFLADPQTGAWYPLNWPFFLLGIESRSIEWELALHALLACLGAFFLARELLGSWLPALFCGAFYGFSGFFAGHSSHVGIFQAAALMPWLLWTTHQAIAARERLRWSLAAGLTGACIILVGHFQSALYAFFALILFIVANELLNRGRSAKIALLVLVVVALLTALGSAISWLPGLELTEQSIRAGADYSRQTNGALVTDALATLIFPDHYGVLGGTYRGPEDITQFYFYAGLLLAPLAIAGLFAARVRWLALALIGPCLWYAFGPSGGLYLLIARLPGFRSVRAPVHVWFVVALGLALLAAGGVQVLQKHFPQPWLAGALLLVVCADLWHSNMDINPLAYGHFDFESHYGAGYDRMRQLVAPFQQPPYRIWAPQGLVALNSSLVYPTEVTSGYNPLELSRYSRYLDVAQSNAKLVNSLSATVKVGNTGLAVNPDALPWAFFAGRLRSVPNFAEAASALPALDPAAEVVAENLPHAISQDSHAVAQITNYEVTHYRVHYRCASESLLRMAVPFFPGWAAKVDGREVAVVPADAALTGVLAPAGEHDLDFSYHSTWWTTGLLLSVLTWLGGLYPLFSKLARKRDTI